MNSMEIKQLLRKSRAFFSDQMSLALFDLYAGAAEAGLEFAPLSPVLELKQISATLLSDLRRIEKLPKPRRYFMYGGGGHCREILESKTDMHVMTFDFDGFENFEAIVDANMSESEKYGLPVIPYGAFKSRFHDAGNIVLCISNYDRGVAREVLEMLRNDGFAGFIHREIIDVGRKQYFDFFSEKGLFTDHEVFVHAGCADGFSQRCFAEYADAGYKKMITFEPSSDFDRCVENLADMHDVFVYKYGLGDKTETVFFRDESDKDQGSRVSEVGSEKIDVVALDDFLAGEDVTFIALDVEGYELKILRGAENTIRTQRPKLAVSVYHKPEDIYEIPIFIKSMNPDYKLALRNYGRVKMDDTVCYAYE